MGFGIFGKLPQKRDFVTFGIPRDVLNPFETWLQAAVAASRNELGRNWEEIYLVAPIWRFWIGYEIFGQACAGAVMPSVDKVGRFFPLALLHCDDAGEATAPPPFLPREEWFRLIEERLLSALDESLEVAVESLLEDLPEPPPAPEPPQPDAPPFKAGAIWQGEAGSDPAELVSSIVQADYWRATSARSYWWTAGGGSGVPSIYAGPGLPDPYLFSRMLAGPDGATR